MKLRMDTDGHEFKKYKSERRFTAFVFICVYQRLKIYENGITKIVSV
jgi:hypothetical protein